MEQPIPNSIKQIVVNEEYIVDSIGKSESKILMYNDFVLKIMRGGEDDKTVQLMKWLYGKLPIPHVINYEIENDYHYLLMSRIRGKPASERDFCCDPYSHISILASALKMLWRVNISGCPRDKRNEDKVVQNKLLNDEITISIESFLDDCISTMQIDNHQELSDWFINFRAPIEPALCHGDLSLYNIIIDNNNISGLVDFDYMGIADKWRDIASCYRRINRLLIHSNFTSVERNHFVELFFDLINISPNYEKLLFFCLVDRYC